MRFFDDQAVYHVVSRVAFRRFLFDDEAKGKFVDLMRRQAAFCGGEISAFCVMSNHFHLLVSFPEPDKPLSDKAILKRYKALYPRNEWVSEKTLSPDRLELILENGDSEADRVREKILARMGNLSVFMKELKQRFSIWFNRNRDNVGTLWEAKYCSQLVENSREAVRLVAAYIEMNPVRAGIVENAEAYQWSSLGKARVGWRALGESCFKLWFDDLALAHATLAECDFLHVRDRRMLVAGCIGTAAFVRRMCERWIPRRLPHFKPIEFANSMGDSTTFTLRRIEP